MLFNDYDNMDEQANNLSQLLGIISPLFVASAQQPTNHVRSLLSQLVLSSLQSFKTNQRENGPCIAYNDGINSYFPQIVDIDSIMQSIHHFDKTLKMKQQQYNTQEETLQKTLINTIQSRQRQTKINFSTKKQQSGVQPHDNDDTTSKRKLKNNELIYNDLLSYIFSFINCLQFPALENVSHQFFQCVRSPMSITHVNSEFLEKMCDGPNDVTINNYARNMLTRIYDTNTKMNGTIHIEESEFLNNKKVFITNKKCKLHTKEAPRIRVRGECYKNGSDYLNYKVQTILSYLNLTQDTVKTVMKLVFGNDLQRVAIIKCNDKNKKTKELSISNVDCCPMAMITLRGIEYCNITQNTTLEINFEDNTPCFFDNCDYLWYHFDHIQSILSSCNIKDIRVSLPTYVEENPASLFVILSLFLHPNVESINLQCVGPTDHRTINVINSNKIKYKTKMPKLSKLKKLTLNSLDCNYEDALFVQDGNAFCNVLISNTKILEELRIEDWYKTWIIVSDDWVLNNYKTLKHLIFEQGDECAQTKFNDKESWMPVYFIKRMIDIYENKITANYTDKIQFWFENVLRKFKFCMRLYNPHIRGDVGIDENPDCYHDEYKQDIDQIDEFLRLVLYIKGFFQRLNIENECIVHWNCTCWEAEFYEQHFDGMATYFDQEFPLFFKIGSNYKIDPSQSLLSKWFK